MAGRPTPAGPRNLRELFHYIYKWTTSIYDETAPAVSSAHPAVTVTDTSTVDLSVSGSQVLSASVVPDSIGYTQLDATVEADIANAGHIIAENSVALTHRSKLNFDGTHFDLSDDAGNNETDVNLSTADIAALALAHAAVTVSDTATIGLTLAGQLISGIVIDDSITNTKLANVPTQTFKGRTTAATGDPEDLTITQAKALLSLSGINSGDQTITLTGEVTGSGTGSFAATVQPAAITNRSVIAVDRAADYIVFYDASGAVLGKALASTWDLLNDTTPQLGGTLDALLLPIENLQYIEIQGLATYGAGGLETQKSPFIDMIANRTWDYVVDNTPFGNSLTLPAAVQFGGTQTIKQSMFSLAGGFLFWASPTIKNDSALTPTLSGVYTLADNTTYQADTGIVPLVGLCCTAFSNMTFNRTAGGTLSGSGVDVHSFRSVCAVNNATTTIGNRLGLSVGNASGAGTLTNQAGVVVDDLLKGGTSNVEILAGQTAYPAGSYNFYQGNEKRSRFNGAREYKVSTGTADRTLDNTHHFVQLTGATNRNFTFPAANTCKGREYVLKKSGTGNITPVMAGGSGDTIDGAAPVALTVQHSSRTYVSDGGTNWLITGAYL